MKMLPWCGVKKVLVIRDDFVLLKQTFYDQDFEPLKVMETTEIKEIGGGCLRHEAAHGEVGDTGKLHGVSHPQSGIRHRSGRPALYSFFPAVGCPLSE